MDISDQATEREEQERARALSQRRPSGPPPCGQCHYCGEGVGSDLRFCDADCARDFEYEAERRRINGAVAP